MIEVVYSGYKVGLISFVLDDTRFIYFDTHVIADCSSVYWVIFCQKHLVAKDSYMRYSTTHFSIANMQHKIITC